METILSAELLKIYSDVVELQLRDIFRPKAYENNVQYVESARSSIIVAKNQRKQQIVTAKTKLTEAYQEANKTIDTANTNSEANLKAADLVADTLRDKYTRRTEIYTLLQNYGFSIKQIIEYVSNTLYTRGKISVKKNV